MPTETEALRFSRVGIRFPARRGSSEMVTAVEEIDLVVKGGEFVSVVGPSGCGKSTLLNMAAGLLKPSRGEVFHRGSKVSGINTEVGYITQQDNLLPWQSTWKNIELGLRIRGMLPAERKERVAEWIDLVGLRGFEGRYPSELSGGMRKRAAIARTLCYDPDTVLLDEPFGALDAQTKVLMQDELLRIWQRNSNKTMLFITHDLAEAVALSDRVIVLSPRPGRVVAEYEVPLPRPRVMRDLRFSPEFNRVHELLWDALQRAEPEDA